MNIFSHKNMKKNSDGLLAEYLGCLGTAIREEHGPRLRSLLSLSSRSLETTSGIADSLSSYSFESIHHVVSRQYLQGMAEWADVISHHIHSLVLLHTAGYGDVAYYAGSGTRKPSHTCYVEAYDGMVSGLTSFLKVFREDAGSWLVDPMHSVVHNLYALADMADRALKRGNMKECKLVDCGDQLRKCFSVSLQAPNNKEKKLAALDIVNVSIKIYFKLNTLRLCKNLIRTVESKQFPSFDVFPVSQKVTYNFYLGRLAVFDEKYHEAQDALTYALKHCHVKSEKNKALILKYLIPVGLLLGRLPSPRLVQRYHGILGPYVPLAESLRSGNIGMFYETMREQRDVLVKDGTYLLLEKLQASVYRRLLRNVWIIHAQQEPDKAAQIPLSMFETALNVAGMSIEMDEIECIAANLISRKYVKGYMSHKLKVMVVHKTQPFPDLGSVILVDD